MRRDQIIYTNSEEYIKSFPTQKQLDLLQKLGYGDCSSWTRQDCQKQISYCLSGHNNRVSTPCNSWPPTDNPFEIYLNCD